MMSEKWIPANRELPPSFVPVLVFVPKFRAERSVRIAYRTADGTWCSDRNQWVAHAVKAWRPMPKPPTLEEVLG